MKLNKFPLAVPALIISEDLWQCHCYLFEDSLHSCIGGSLTFFYMSVEERWGASASSSSDLNTCGWYMRGDMCVERLSIRGHVFVYMA